MTNGEIREGFLILPRSFITHVKRGNEPRVNVEKITMTSTLTDFVRMKPPIIHGSMGGKDT